MKLILTEPKGKYSFNYGDLLSAWFKYNDIYIGQLRTNFECDYNEIYKFYDLTLIEFENNIEYAKTAHFQETVEFLKSEGYKVETMPSWRWKPTENGNKKLEAIRIFIYIVESEKKESNMKTGDVVKLKLTSTRMTVHDIRKNMVCCQWFDNFDLREEEFKKDDLEILNNKFYY